MSALTRRASDVRITEYDLSTTIAINSNATAAMVGVSSKGPTVPTFYSNFDDFTADWGNPDAKTSFDHYMAMQFFQDGNSMWAVRAVGAGALYSAAVVKYNSSTMTTSIASLPGVANPNSPQWSSYVSGSDDPLFLITARKGPGSYGNSLAVTIQSTSIDSTGTVTPSQSSTGGVLPAGTYTYRVAAVGAGGESLASALASVTVVSGTTNQVTLNWAAVPGAIGYYIYGRNGTISRLATVGATTNTYTDIGAAVANGVDFPITDPANLPLPTGVFTLNVYDTSSSSSVPVESFTCSVTEQTDETGAQMEIMQRVNPFSKYIRVQSNVFSLLYTPILKSISTQVLFGGGASGATPTGADINNAFNVFLNKELYVVDVLINSGRAVPSIQKNMELIARTRSDAVAFLDVPSSMQDMQSARDYRNLTLNLNSSYASLFCPDLLIQDPINGKLLLVPPSGSMAGLYARTSTIAQPWFSIAGLNRGLLNVLDVRNTYDDGQATLLFQSQINYMRKFVGKGIPLWEQTTMFSNNSALQFLNVRFLCNIIKRSVYQFLIYSLQEPGDDILRKQIKFGLEEFLKLVKAARGISDYRVVCDKTNNPDVLVNSGILAVAIVITPILAVREIRLALVISKEGLQISEETIASFSA